MENTVVPVSRQYRPSHSGVMSQSDGIDDDALSEERERVLQGAYDAYPGEVKEAGSITFKLAEHLREILAKIGVRGEELNVALHPSRI